MLILSLFPFTQYGKSIANFVTNSINTQPYPHALSYTTHDSLFMIITLCPHPSFGLVHVSLDSQWVPQHFLSCWLLCHLQQVRIRCPTKSSIHGYQRLHGELVSHDNDPLLFICIW